MPSQTPRFWALVPAAGSGNRVGADRPKQYLAIGDRSMLEITVRGLREAGWIERVLVVCAPGDRLAADLLAADPRVVVLPEGGATRRDTVLGGLRWLLQREPDAGDDWVLVHDAARPGLAAGDLERLRQSLVDTCDDPLPDCALLATRVADTVRRAIPGTDRGAATVDRSDLWLAQTPQACRVGRLFDALTRAPQVTDEASAIEALGGSIRLIEGSSGNFKVTTPDDLERMRTMLGVQPMNVRVGQGYDVHALVPGRTLILGGIRVEHSQGLLGHSDADVLAHAVTDAVLGAAGLGDIGRHFPDTDATFAGADSLKLLAEAARRVRARGFRIVNVDSTVVCQAPRLAAHLPAMAERLAEALGIDTQSVNVKAKTTERLGFEGRGEGISAQAVALVAGG
jgi:2-C-methyl-D-erythritol 4-phosphate cytidylyltransferase/2-C-methyl-D-erythritol 2,4-cyclodiphosphate synthase